MMIARNGIGARTRYHTGADQPAPRAMAERIPGARFVSVHRGGHTLTHLDADARRAIADFMDAAGRPAANDFRVLTRGG